MRAFTPAEARRAGVFSYMAMMASPGHAAVAGGPPCRRAEVRRGLSGRAIVVGRERVVGVRKRDVDHRRTGVPQAMPRRSSHSASIAGACRRAIFLRDAIIQALDACGDSRLVIGNRTSVGCRPAGRTRHRPSMNRRAVSAPYARHRASLVERRREGRRYRPRTAGVAREG